VLRADPLRDAVLRDPVLRDEELRVEPEDPLRAEREDLLREFADPDLEDERLLLRLELLRPCLRVAIEDASFVVTMRGSAMRVCNSRVSSRGPALQSRAAFGRFVEALCCTPA
jgi:hypothetical protein